MIKRIFFLLFLFTGIVSGQNYDGFIDNYSGINGVIYNPSSIHDTQLKFEINVLSTQITGGSDYAYYNFSQIWDAIETREIDFDNLDRYVKSTNLQDESHIYASFDLLGPSFMLSLNRFYTIGFTTRARGIININDINTNVYEELNDKTFLEQAGFLAQNGTVNLNGLAQSNIWSEYGITFAGTYKHNKKYLLKYGATVKYLKGLFYQNSILNNVTATLDTSNLLDIHADLTGTANNAVLDLDNTSDTFNGSGLGLDIGFTYENRKKNLHAQAKDKNGFIYYKKTPYSYRLGFSITDIGSIKYKNVSVSDYEVEQKIDENTSLDFGNLLNTSSGTTEEKFFLLPTMFRSNFDFKSNNKWFFNTNVDLSLISSTSDKGNKYLNQITFTPRYESKSFSVFLPFSLNQFNVFSSGIGIRTNCFFINSNSLLSNIFLDSQQLGFSFGIKVPIYDKKKVREYRESINYFSNLD